MTLFIDARATFLTASSQRRKTPFVDASLLNQHVKILQNMGKK